MRIIKANLLHNDLVAAGIPIVGCSPISLSKLEMELNDFESKGLILDIGGGGRFERQD